MKKIMSMWIERHQMTVGSYIAAKAGYAAIALVAIGLKVMFE